jgi:hypothetical protein
VAEDDIRRKGRVKDRLNGNSDVQKQFFRFFLRTQVLEKQFFGLPAAWAGAKKAVLRLDEANAVPYLCIIKQQPPTGRPC